MGFHIQLLVEQIHHQCGDQGEADIEKLDHQIIVREYKQQGFQIQHRGKVKRKHVQVTRGLKGGIIPPVKHVLGQGQHSLGVIRRQPGKQKNNGCLDGKRNKQNSRNDDLGAEFIQPPAY
ncbi:hypothetical protein D3C75_889660 [compost metagenome]